MPDVLWKLAVGVLATAALLYLVAAAVVWKRWPLLRPSFPRLRGRTGRVAAALGALGAVAAGASVISASARADDSLDVAVQPCCHSHRQMVLHRDLGPVVIHIQDGRGG